MLRIKIVSLLIIIFIILVILSIINFTLTYQYSGKDKLIVIKNKTSVFDISKILKDEGVFPHENLLYLVLKFISQFHTLKAGEYKIAGQSELYLIIRDMIKGKFYQRQLIIPPGLTNHEIGRIFNQAMMDCEKINEDENYYFLPDTYYYTYDMNCKFLINFIRENSNKVLDKVWNENNNPVLKNKSELLILASIIEKESSRDDEIYNISAVFSNRIKNSMKLQADPTTIYSITKGKVKFDRLLTYQDLLIKDDYNTYNIIGLPPGKICNPSLKSLKAAANPADVNYLYFVADNNGSHLFSNSLEKHNKNINLTKRQIIKHPKKKNAQTL